MDLTVPTQPDTSTPDGRLVVGAEDPLRSRTTYELVFNDPDAPAPSYGLGWTLVGWQNGGTRRWTSSLAAHGAGAHTGPRVAKAVAVRVLATYGVAVEGWRDDQSGDMCVSRAVLVTEPSASGAPGIDHTGSTSVPALPRVRVRRLRRSPGR